MYVYIYIYIYIWSVKRLHKERSMKERYNKNTSKVFKQRK